MCENLRRLVKTLDDQEDIEDIAAIHYRVAALFGRQGDFQNALIHMLACLLRNQAIDSEFVQRDAMVLMDIRDRIGRIEFEFLVEKKMGQKIRTISSVVDGLVSSRIDRSFVAADSRATGAYQNKLTFLNPVAPMQPIPSTANVTTASEADCRHSGAHTESARLSTGLSKQLFQTCRTRALRHRRVGNLSAFDVESWNQMS